MNFLFKKLSKSREQNFNGNAVKALTMLRSMLDLGLSIIENKVFNFNAKSMNIHHF